MQLAMHIYVTASDAAFLAVCLMPCLPAHNGDLKSVMALHSGVPCRALVFGGDTCTATDVAVRLGKLTVGTPELVQSGIRVLYISNRVFCYLFCSLGMC